MGWKTQEGSKYNGVVFVRREEVRRFAKVCVSVFLYHVVVRTFCAFCQEQKPTEGLEREKGVRGTHKD